MSRGDQDRHERGTDRAPTRPADRLVRQRIDRVAWLPTGARAQEKARCANTGPSRSCIGWDAVGPWNSGSRSDRRQTA